MKINLLLHIGRVEPDIEYQPLTPVLGLGQVWESLDPPGLLDDDVDGGLLLGNHPSGDQQRLPQHHPERDVSELALQGKVHD